MFQNDTFEAIADHLKAHRLGTAIEQLENYMLMRQQQSRLDELQGIKKDYELMADYWSRGYDDPERQQLYARLLQRVYVVLANLAVSERVVRGGQYLSALYALPRRLRSDWAVASIRRELESFVTDVAMLELEPEHVRKDKSRQVHERHHQLTQDLFSYIVTSRQWPDSLTRSFEEMLLSPTIDTIDQQLMVSAITLSGMNTFDFNKFRLLLSVYQQASDEPLRQRALVGWVLCADASMQPVYGEMATLIGQACQDEACRSELTELQMQLYYCTDAEEDTRTIQKEIFPELMKGSRLRITGHGLEEQDDDTLEDILHPEAAEQNLERMEQSMHRMMDMQKQGADIYFGGFSQMKRFPFFGTLANWFVPFYAQHPAISQIWEQTKARTFLQLITQAGAFCDSDKYSFVLAFNHVLDHIPASMLKLVEQGEATPMPVGGIIDAEEQRQPAFIRRVYLQNLYRFYRLFPNRQEFRNPFEPASLLFFAQPLLADDVLAGERSQVVGFLSKRKYYQEALSVLDNGAVPEADFHYCLTKATVLYHLRGDALPLYEQALQLQPHNERALAGYARAAFRRGDSERALGAYQQLLTLQPDHRGHLLNLAVCLLNVGRTEEALQPLYKLNYLYPDDAKVTRVLAWAHTLNGKYEQAQRLFAQLQQADQLTADDVLNYAFCQWFARQMADAIALLRQWQQAQGDDKAPSLGTVLGTDERPFLLAHGVTDVEIALMIDATR